MKGLSYYVVSLAVFLAPTAHAQSAKDILKGSGVRGGLVVHLGCADGKLTAALRANDSYLVHGLDTDRTNVTKAREHIRSKGLYGPVSVDVFDGKRLPYADNLVNLLVAEELGPGAPGMKEVMRVLAPLGVAYIGGKKTPKPWPKEIDEWTHFLHGPDNNAVSRDRTVNLPRTLQWVDGQRWNRTHEELSSISALVTANGRLFYIADKAPAADIRFSPQWKVVARDAFNGILLWEKDVPVWNDHMRHFRSGPLHLPRRLVAAGDRVYVTLGLDAPLSALDAATGDVVRTYAGTKWAEEILFHEGILYLLVGSSEADRFGGGLAERGEPARSKTRELMAVEERSGRVLWRKNAKAEDYILPLGIALCGDRLYHHSVKGLTCLKAKTGKQLWFVPRSTPAKRYAGSTSTLVATDDVILLADHNSRNANDKGSDIKWAVNGWPKEGFSRTPGCTLTAYSSADGKKLWERPCGEGFYVPVDVFVCGGLVWTGPFNKRIFKKEGYDLETGEVKSSISIKGRPVGMVHDRCYRNKASLDYIFTCRDGIEVIDQKKGWVRNNSWVRGPCQLGIMPANGLMYAPPDPCACHLTSRIQGFVALSSRRMDSIGKPITEEGRLEKGAAYAKEAGAAVKADAWPTYRHDSRRGGFASSKVAASPKNKWTADIGGRLTQAVSAWGKVFVASIDKHTVYALDAETGKVLWSYTTGGRVDSAPTLYKGRVLFGSRDGYVYNLDAKTGELAWRFHAAPEQHMICVQGQMESAWPVHGAVLVQNGELYFTSGRSTYLAGGIYFYRLDPISGKMQTSNVITHIDPKTGKELGAEQRAFNSEGAVSDVLSGNGESVFMNYMTLDKDGREEDIVKPHLFSATGILGEEWFVRSYWTVATTVKGAGYTGWTRTADRFPFGRILCFGDNQLFGYGRRQVKPMKDGHRSMSYRLFASGRDVMGIEPEKRVPVAPPQSGRRTKKRTTKKKGVKAKAPTAARPTTEKKGFGWAKSVPFTVRAMAGTSGKLVVAGVPSKAKKGPGEGHVISFANPKEALDAFEGRLGSFLWVLSASNANQLAQIKLPAMPVFDGTSIADGGIYVSLKDGTLVCFK